MKERRADKTVTHSKSRPADCVRRRVEKNLGDGRKPNGSVAIKKYISKIRTIQGLESLSASKQQPAIGMERKRSKGEEL